MAGVAIWTDGAGDGDWSTAGNWGTSSGTPSAPPGTGDSVIINTGARDINAGLNQSAVTLVGITITEGFKYSIGTSSAALQINSSGSVNIAVAGAYIKLNGTFTASTPKMFVRFKSAGFFGISGGTVTNLYLGGNGTVDIDAGAIVTNIHSIGPQVTAGANGTGFTVANIQGGQLSTARGISNGIGTLVCTNARVILRTAAAVTLGYVGSGGTLNHQSTGTITDLYLAGSFNADNNTSATPPTITNLYKMIGASVSRSMGSGAVTITNEYPIAGA